MCLCLVQCTSIQYTSAFMRAASLCSSNISVNHKTTTFPRQTNDSLVVTAPFSSLVEEFGLGEHDWLMMLYQLLQLRLFPGTFTHFTPWITSQGKIEIKMFTEGEPWTRMFLLQPPITAQLVYSPRSRQRLWPAELLLWGRINKEIKYLVWSHKITRTQLT